MKWLQYLLFIVSRKPNIIISFGNSFGDDLLCSIIIKQLKRKGAKNIWIKTLHPDLFSTNPYINRIIIPNKNRLIDNAINRRIQNKKTKLIQPFYTQKNVLEDSDTPPTKHIINLMCDVARVEYYSNFKPEIYLTKEEISTGKLSPNQICIQSTGISSANFMSNKEWIPKRFKSVVEELIKTHTIIQIGSQKDFAIEGVIDMRGKTSIRETASLLHNSSLFIGLVGGLMHLAKSVDCKSVIIYGGREHPNQSGYESNINLYSEVPCAPCWKWNTCDYDKRCMSMISAQHVLEAATHLINGI